MTKRLPFESPPPVPATTGEVVATIAAGVGVVALAFVLHPLHSVARVAGLLVPTLEEPPFDVEAALRQCDADQTRGPELDERGFVECVRCSAFVPYASMSLNEDGCFCRICAERVTAAALEDAPILLL